MNFSEILEKISNFCPYFHRIFRERFLGISADYWERFRGISADFPQNWFPGYFRTIQRFSLSYVYPNLYMPSSTFIPTQVSCTLSVLSYFCPHIRSFCPMFILSYVCPVPYVCLILRLSCSKSVLVLHFPFIYILR